MTLIAGIPWAVSTGPALGAAEGTAFVEPTVWAPYFKDDKGVKFNLTEPLEKIEDKLWMGMQWTAYKGPKLLLSIQVVDNTRGKMAAVAPPDPNNPAAVLQYQAMMQAQAVAAMYGQRTAEVPVAGIEDLMATALINSHRFELLERKDMSKIMAEKRLDASKDEAPAVNLQKNLNKIITAPYTIQGSVTEWTPDKSKVGGGGGGIGGGLGAMIGVNKTTAEVAMTFRIIDTQTTKIVDSVTVRATAKNWGFDIGGLGFGGRGVAGGKGGMQEKSPVSYAVIAAINKGVYELAKRLGDKPWVGHVSQARNGVVYIAGGADKGLEEGMVLRALKVGEEIKDPSTGEVLDVETTPLGTLRLTTVKEKYSLATPIQGCEGIATGDRVEAAPGPSIFGKASAPKGGETAGGAR